MRGHRRCRHAGPESGSFLRNALVIVLALVCVSPAMAAEASEGSYSLGEVVMISTSPGATGLAIGVGDQSYRFLGAPDPVVSFQPQIAGEYRIQETLSDGAVIETRFSVTDAPQVNRTADTPTPPSGTPLGETPTANDTVPGGNATIDQTAPRPPAHSSVGPPLLDAPGIDQDGAGNGTLTSSAIVGVAHSMKQTLPAIERDERAIGAVNQRIRLRTGHGTGIVAGFTINSGRPGSVHGSTDDLGARLPETGSGDVAFDLPERHARKIALRGVDFSRGIDLGVDDVPQSLVDAPASGRGWAAVYAIDPTNLSFSGGTLKAIAEGTELYKCRTWDFDARVCPGSWEKIMDLTPGQEYLVEIGPDDPGFAESTVAVGYSGETSDGAIFVTGSISSPLETANTEWAVTIHNPTNRTINITKVIFTATGNIFNGVTGISPSSTWSFTAGRVNWTGVVILDPQNTTSIVANVRGVSSNIANVLVEINVTTNDTNASTNGYTTSTRNANIQGPTMYFNDTGALPYSRSDPNGTAVSTFTIDVDNAAGVAAVPIGTMLAIHVPPGWRNLTQNAQSGWSVGSVMGDEGAGWVLISQVATSTIAAGSARNFTFSALPPDRNSVTTYHFSAYLFGPGANSALSVSSTFTPGLRVLNQSTRNIDENDMRYAITRTNGGSNAIDQYVSVPSPFDSVAANTWGVAVVNPTNFPINVTQIDIQTSVNMFGAVTAVHPAATWTLASASDVRWTGNVLIPPHGAQSFAANISATATSTTIGTVTYTTVTNASTLTTSGLVTGMSTGNIQFPSVFALNATSQTYALTNLSPTKSEKFTIRVSNRGSSAAIPIGTAFDILIPPGWLNISSPAQTNWTVTHVRSDPRGGGIVRAVTATSTIPTNGFRDFTFNATPPMVGTNSTYRFDMWLYGPTAQTTTMGIQSNLQLAVTVVPPIYGILFDRTSDTLPNVSNISSLRVVAIARSNSSTTFNLSIVNASGTFVTINATALSTSDSNWNATWQINRTFDPRVFVNATTGFVIIRWNTTTPNATSLEENLVQVNATYDTLLPIINQTGPLDGAYRNKTSFLLQYDASDDNDLRNCTLFINATVNQTNTTPTNGTGNAFNITRLREGPFNWSLDCYDLNEHRNATGNFTVTIDTITPTVNLTAPSNNTKFNSSSVTFTIVANDTNLANCTIYLNGAANSTNASPAANQQTNFTIVLPDGNTTWTAECSDQAGNAVRNTSTRTVQVDTAFPQYAAITASPASGVIYNSSQRYVFSVNWTDGNGVSRVTFESNISGSLANLTVNVSNGENYSYNFSTIAAGNYVWRMYANDSFNNVNMTTQQTFIIAKAASGVTLLLNGSSVNYAIDTGESVNMTGIVNTPSSGYLEIFVNGTRYANGSSPLQNVSSFSANGSVNVTVYYNESQNYSGSNMTLRLTVGDKQGPNATPIFPANNMYVNTVNVSFIYNVTDATDISNCTLFVNATQNASVNTSIVNNDLNAINGTGFAETNYSWFLRCYDSIGNSRNTTIFVFGDDRTPPAAFNLTAPTNATISRNQSPTLVWNASDDIHFQNYTVIIDNAFDFSSPNYVYNTSPASNVALAVPATLASGTTWWWKAVAYDAAGNSRDPVVPFAYTPDIDAPSVTVSSPMNGSYLSTNTVNVTYTIGDTSVVANCTIAWNDSTTAVNTTLNQSGTNQFSIMKPDGSYRFNITCVDIAENAGIGDTLNVIVDMSAPAAVSLTSPANETFTSNNTPTLTWTQSADANFENYSVLVSDDPYFPYANHSYLISSIGTTTYQVTEPWDDGVWWWKVVVYDKAGNSVDPGNQYTVDSTPPAAFDLLTPVNGTSSVNRTPQLTWEEAADLHFDNYTVLVSSKADMSSVNFSYSRKNSDNTSLDIPGPWDDNTVWYWRVVAWDNASNSRNSTRTLQYITDSQPPAINLTYPANNTLLQTNSSLILFTYNVTDLSPIVSCTLTVNDTSGVVVADDDPFVTRAANETFTESLQTGDYNWSVSCIDAAGNSNTSETRMLSVNVTLPKTGFYDSSLNNSPQLNTSTNTSAMAVYGSNNGTVVVPRYRTWNGTTWSAENAMPDPGSPVRWIRVVANPLPAHAEERVAAMVGDDGYIDAYVWNGTGWAFFPNVSAMGTARNAQRSFDIAYEHQRGRAMLLYSLNSTNVAQDLAYRIWNGTGWEPQVIINDPSSAADISISFIRLAMNPTNASNELTAAYIDVTSTDGRAMIWNGTAWGSFTNVSTAISSTTEEDIAVAYEQNRSRSLAIAGNASFINFAYWNGTAWNQSGFTDVNPSAAGTTNWISASANPVGNEIMLVDVDSGNDLSTAQWANGSWSGALRHDATVDSNAQRSADFAWEPSGSTGLLAWGTTAAQIDTRQYGVSTSWATSSSFATTVNSHTWVLAVTVPTSLSTGTRILIGAEQSNNTLDGARYVSGTPTNLNAAFTGDQGAVTYQRYDISPDLYPPRYAYNRSINLLVAPDGTPNTAGVWTTGGVVMVSNATGQAVSNISANGYYIPKGAGIRYNAMIESENPGISYLTWELYAVNASGETLMCASGNKTRAASDTQVSTTTPTAYAASCTMSRAVLMNLSDFLRSYVWVNSSANNTLTKSIDNASTYIQVDGYPIGNLTVRVVSPTTDPLLSEGWNLTVQCELTCTNGYCIDVEVHQQINTTVSAFNDTDYFFGNLILNSTAVNPYPVGNMNTSLNVTFNLSGNQYSRNNTLRCLVLSQFQNVTSAPINVSVLDSIAPNVTLLSPPNGSGYDPGNITFMINASDRRLGLCSLWTNTTGSWVKNQTIIANNYTYTNFTPINVSAYGTYKWNVNCSDLSGNDTFSPANRTFVIAGDVYVNGSEITFIPSSPVEGQNATIVAIVRNKANRVESNVLVSFFQEDPSNGETQIGQNLTIPTLPAQGNASVNVSLNVSIGVTRIVVIVDPPYGNGSIFESDEMNNRDETNLTVLSWQIYYGNVSGNITLAGGSNLSLNAWYITNNTGNIYIVDTDTTNGINFASLRALGRNTTGGAPASSLNDFEDLDSLINGTNLTDSVNATFTSGGTPMTLGSFEVHGTTIANVPLANSTIDGNHTTGILWDADDSTNAFYDALDAEDIVIVTHIDANRTTIYGKADYAIRVPARLKAYKGTTNTVTIYYELA